MSDPTFDDIPSSIKHVLSALDALPAEVSPLYFVRDLFGKVRITVPEELAGDEKRRPALNELAVRLHKALGAHAHPPENAVLFVDQTMLQDLDDSVTELQPGVYLADRLVTGRGWWTVSEASNQHEKSTRLTLYSIEGGVGRSTTAAVLAWHLARTGERVMVVDLDLESPGIAPALLERDRRPESGIVDWFVQDLVGQGDPLIERMAATPEWAQDFEGDVHIVPAHGRMPGEYLAKLGRVYLDNERAWTARLAQLLQRLEVAYQPSIILLESRSGLHDLAAATVTDLDAQVLLFAVDSESTWDGYEILFRHWQDHDLARRIRDRLWIVSALTPEVDTQPYLQRFRERSWELFRNHLYDEVAPSVAQEADFFSFDLDEDSGPHVPLPIFWNRGLAPGSSLRDLQAQPVKRTYDEFLRKYDELITPIGSPAP